MTTDHPNPPKPKLRWFQYSLRTLLVLMTVLCVWLGVTVERARKQREAVAAIEELGGEIVYEHETIAQAELHSPKWLRELIGDEYFVSVLLVVLYDTQVTDAGLEHLKGFTKLKTLFLGNTQVTDDGLEHLKGLTKLEFLSLLRTQVTDAGLEHLKGLTNLQSLYLRNTQVTDAGLEHLKGLTNLQSLYLRNTQVTDEGVEYLKGLTKLQTLNLADTQVTDAGVKKLQQALPNCKIHH